MHAFDVLGDPVRRRIIELIAEQESSAGEVTSVIMSEFKISQPAVSRHLRILREGGFATQRSVGTRRLYALDEEGLEPAKAWIGRVERFWGSAMDALHTEIVRQNRAARSSTTASDQHKKKRGTS